MKICVINGSPRGQYSVTLHTSLYLEKRFSQHSFEYVDVGRRIRHTDEEMQKAEQAMHAADVVLFSYPVYTFIAPSQLHFFFRRLKERGCNFEGKFATQISTSKHFYDVTAHRYVEENCQDLGMKVIHGLSADMEDLTTEKGQRDAEHFMEYLQACVEQDIYEPRMKQKTSSGKNYVSDAITNEKKQGKEIVLVADLHEGDENLRMMMDDFVKAAAYPVKVVNIAEYPFQGGCLGCFNCAGDGVCIYKDRFDSFLRESIQNADATVYAFTICDHSMGPQFKMYDDRQFCNGHRTVTEGKPVGYLINGDIEMEANLKTILEARSEVGHNFLAGIAQDAASMNMLLRRLDFALENNYVQPRNFYGVGGMKIFRDLIWVMRGLMKADHLFYKKHGVYDFPQKQWGKMLAMNLLGSLVRNPKIKAKMGNKMNEGMVAPYRKVLKKTECKKN
ncbi:MAG: iron-sulfur protein [Clostridiales bacterium]|nr:iron-sulfur protein [Clostridiales bacterium]